MGQFGAPLVGSYDHRLVVLSVFIAVLASYIALDLAACLRPARGGVRWLSNLPEFINMKIRDVIFAILLGIGVISVFLLVTPAIAYALGSYPKREFGR